MKSSTVEAVAVTPLARSLLADYRELTKPRITFLVVLTALSGYVMGGRPEPWILIFTLLGTALSCAGAGAINMVIEHESDALMVRTKGRPIPSGRIRPRPALLFGLALCTLGVAVLARGAGWLPAAVSTATILIYTLVYTPLKLRMKSAIMVGAIPGALPPVIGWTAATGGLGAGALALFGILYVWQIPHFLAIDWLYRADYLRGGFRTIAVSDPAGGSTSRRAILYALLLIPVSLLPTYLGFAGNVYLVGALLLGCAYLWGGVRLARDRSDASARNLLLLSVSYLPVVLILMALDKRPL